jgi:uncharacterized membrane protein
MERVKKPLFLFSLLYTTVYVPLFLMIYFPNWYLINCRWHPRCELFGKDKTLVAVEELTSFFRHSGELSSMWTRKERLHLSEVRGIFDRLAIIAVVSAFLIALTFDARYVSLFSLINVSVVVSLLIVLPFFNWFWIDVFHPLLFDNELWKNNMRDVSFYIMPRQFFKFSILFIVFISCFINLILWFCFKNKRR